MRRVSPSRTSKWVSRAIVMAWAGRLNGYKGRAMEEKVHVRFPAVVLFRRIG